MTVGELVAYLGVDDREFNSKLDAGERKFSGFGSHISRMAGTIGKVAITGIAVAAAAGAAAIGVSLVKGFQRLSAIEDARASLRGLGYDAGVVKKIMDNALASVLGTAFGLDEAAQVAAGTVAAGIQPGKQLTSTLKLVADAATIAKMSMGEMGSIFNKVAASNKIQGEVIAQLNDAGVPIVQMMGKVLHKTAGEVVNLASAGKINFKTFSEAMQAGLGGAALKSGNTTTGAFKNMMAAVSRFGAGLLTGVFPLVKVVFGAITRGLDDLGVKIGPVLEKLGKGLGKWLKSDQAAGIFAAIVSAARTAIPIIWDVLKAVAGFVGKVIGGIGAVVAFVRANWPSIVAAFRTMEPTFAALDEVVQSFVGMIVRGVTKIVGFVRDHWSTIGPILKAAWDTSIAASKAFFAVLAPILKAVAAVLRGDFSDAWSHVKEAVAAGMKGMGSVAEAGKKLIVIILRALARAAVDELKKMPGRLANLGENAMRLLARAIAAGVKASISNVARMPGQIAGALKALAGLLLSAGAAGMRGLLKGLQSIWGAVAEYVKGIPGKVKGFFSGAATWLLSIGSSIMSGLLSGITSAWDHVATFLGGLGEKIKSLKGPIEQDRLLLVPIGKAIMHGLAHGMKKGSAEALRVAADMAGSILSAFGSALGIGDAIATLEAQGLPTAQVAKGWAKKVAALIHAMTDAMQSELKKIKLGKKGSTAGRFGAAAGMAGDMASIFAAFTELTPESVDKALAGITAAKAKAKLIAAALGDLIKTFRANLKTQITEGQSGNADRALGMASGIAGIFGTFVDLTPETVAKAMAGISAAKAQVGAIAAAVADMVTGFRAAIGALIVTDAESGNAGNATNVAGTVAGILGSFADMTVEGIEKAIVGMNEAARRTPELATAMVAKVRSLQTALAGVTTGDEFSGLVSSVTQIASDITGVISSLGSMTEKAIQDGIWGAGWVAKRAMDLGDALRKMVGWLAAALASTDTAALTGLQEKLGVLADIAGKTASIVSDLSGMTPASLGSAFGAFAAPRGGAAMATGGTYVTMNVGTVYATSPAQAQAAGQQLMTGAILKLAQAKRATSRGAP